MKVVRRRAVRRSRRHLAPPAPLGRRPCASTVPSTDDELRAARGRAVLGQPIADAGRVRITVTGGSGPAGLGPGRAPGHHDRGVVAPVAPGPPPPTVVVVPWPRNERGAAGRGEDHVLRRERRRPGARPATAAPARRSSPTPSATCARAPAPTCSSGIGGELVTPPLSAGCLAGVTRELLLELVDGGRARPARRARWPTPTRRSSSSSTRDVQPIADGRRASRSPAAPARSPGRGRGLRRPARPRPSTPDGRPRSVATGRVPTVRSGRSDRRRADRRRRPDGGAVAGGRPRPAAPPSVRSCRSARPGRTTPSASSTRTSRPRVAQRSTWSACSRARPGVRAEVVQSPVEAPAGSRPAGPRGRPPSPGCSWSSDTAMPRQLGGQGLDRAPRAR